MEKVIKESYKTLISVRESNSVDFREESLTKKYERFAQHQMKRMVEPEIMIERL